MDMYSLLLCQASEDGEHDGEKGIRTESSLLLQIVELVVPVELSPKPRKATEPKEYPCRDQDDNKGEEVATMTAGRG